MYNTNSYMYTDVHVTWIIIARAYYGDGVPTMILAQHPSIFTIVVAALDKKKQVLSVYKYMYM